MSERQGGPHPSARAPGQPVQLSAFVAPDGEFRTWMRANLADGTRIAYERQIDSIVLPLLGSYFLTEIDEDAVKRMRDRMRLVRCPSCEALQSAEEAAKRN